MHLRFNVRFNVYFEKSEELLLKTTLATLLLVLCSMVSLGQGRSTSGATQIAKLKTQPVSYCELINNEKNYDGQSVRVEAIYVTFFEKSVIFLPDCRDGIGREYQTWVEFNDSLSDIKRQRHMIKRINKLQDKVDERYGGGAAMVVFRGTFQGSGHYGHLGGYRFRLQVDSIESVGAVPKRTSR